MACLRNLLFFSAVIVLLIPVGGCGGSSGPQRYDLSGSVTYNGKPVPAGHLTFAPDKANGNSGPGASANIEKGRYQTMPGQGPVCGPHVVTISGFDGVPKGMNMMGTRLFEQTRIDVDLPKQNGTLDFEVPSGGGRK